ncbi:jg21952 [Pararge aegeria aegeria]|uniref:Jg21952 protein n=1 Tax=Pararge aegeria aegeria TaxID=348720 RepID=A0A8S4SFZ4_9NEOP|nr:jg21952 [Pararge aegeria aegeria]
MPYDDRISEYSFDYPVLFPRVVYEERPMCCYYHLLRSQTRLPSEFGDHGSQKWKWAGHVARAPSNKWTKRTSPRKGPKGIRKRRRPKVRWADEIESVAGENWLEIALNRAEWQKME